MKIGDVQEGAEYGAVDSPTQAGYGVTPRQVKVIGIVTVEEKYWSGGGFSSSRATRNVRRVKVKVLDEKTPGGGGRWGDVISAAAKGATLTVEARQLVALWSDIHPQILAKIAEKQAIAEKEADITRRFKAIGFKKFGYGDVEVRARDSRRITVTFSDEHVEKLLKLLEAST